MNANEVVSVVLALSGEPSGWGTERFDVPIGGIPALVRVQRALSSAGVGDVGLVHDGGAVDESLWMWTARPPTSAAALEKSARGRAVLVLRGDLPLLTSDTIRAFLAAARAAPGPEFRAESDAMVLFRTADRASRFVTQSAQEGGREPRSASGATWQPERANDLAKLSSPGDFGLIQEEARRRKIAALGAAGVLVIDPSSTYCDDDVAVGPRTALLPGTHLKAGTSIGVDCRIGPDTWIESSAIEDRVVVRYSVVERARVREGSAIGPFAHLRQGSDVGPAARIGNFVEVKAARLGRGVKAGHLSYLGDAEIGEGTNVGAGTITCNYDGEAKHRTVVEEDVFIGSHVSLVAPVTIGREAFLAAGSTITDDVAPGALAIARARQVQKERRERRTEEET